MILEYTCKVCGQSVRKKRSPANLLSEPQFCSQKCAGMARRWDSDSRVKTCTKCGIEKSVSEFYWTTRRGKNVPIQPCQECSRIALNAQYAVSERHAAAVVAKASRTRKSPSEHHRKRRYGLTNDDVKVMIQAQGDKCPICTEELPAKYDLDHDHVTGAVRAVLCPGCNRGLGMFKDDPARLRAAALYLEQHNQDKIESDLGSDVERPAEMIGPAA